MHDLALRQTSSFSRVVPFGVAAAVAASLLTANGALTAAAILSAYALVKLLWRPGEPPVLLYALGYQWLQASMLIFSADLQNTHINYASAERWRSATQIDDATWITLAGVMAVAIGARLVMGSARSAFQAPILRTGDRVATTRLFYASLAAIAVSAVLSGAAFMVSGLSEPVRAILLLRWGIFYLFAYAVFVNRDRYVELAIVLALEIGIGFLGFFSDFKTVLVMTFLAAAAVPNIMRGRARTALVIVVITACLAVVWSSIKKDYRDFLNKGTTGQIILVSTPEQVMELSRLVMELTPEALAEGAEQLIYRISYVDFFASTLDMVPAVIPHENGRLWLEAVEHVLTPRLVNPDKRVINDSDRTREYSGMAVAMGEEGTSISLGYIAETYIDFGPFWMFPALFVVGIGLAASYRLVLRSLASHPLAHGCAAAMIVQTASVLEQTNLKLLGGVVVGLIVLYPTLKYAGPRLIRLIARTA